MKLSNLFRRARTARKTARGMTLLEIMVVITIIGVVMGIVAVAVIPQLDNARVDATKSSIGVVMNSLKGYYLRHGKYPDSGAGLQILVNEGFVESIKDGFGNDMVYTNEGGKPVVTSYGKDGSPGGDGADADISSATMNAGK